MQNQSSVRTLGKLNLIWIERKLTRIFEKMRARTFNLCRLSVLIAGLGLLACGPAEKNVSESKWQVRQGGVTPKGHEILTRLAILRANIALRSLGNSFYPETADSYTVRGNIATDKPDSEVYFSLRSYYGVGPNADWHESSKTQSAHALRPSFDENSHASSGASCNLVKNSIARVTGDVLKSWVEDENKGLFLIGHAAHTIQDSFSPVHMRRQGKQILDVCTFGFDAPEACRHTNIDAVFSDYIWKNPISFYVLGDPENLSPEQQFEELSAEAKMAVEATEGYLTLMAKLKTDPSGWADALDSWLSNDVTAESGSNSGYFQGADIGCNEAIMPPQTAGNKTIHLVIGKNESARKYCKSQTSKAYCGWQKANSASISCFLAIPNGVSQDDCNIFPHLCLSTNDTGLPCHN